jgi:lipopolysaccharide biosynthesis regulator YciM
MWAEPQAVVVGALFAAAAMGWFAGRSWAGRGSQRATTDEPPLKEYLRGLNLVLNEEPDKALGLFLRMVEVDNQTVETHFALGALYRRRGEVDRAIRIHENIIARPTLSTEHREHATFALAEDYYRAGLFDRAEDHFKQVVERSHRRADSLRFLLRIYEQQRDWVQAISTYEQLAIEASAEHPTAIAHYHCELAEIARQAGRYEEARAHLHKVREAQRNFPRGALVRIDVAMDMGDLDTAARLCRLVIELHPQLLPLVLPRLARADNVRSDSKNEHRDLSAWVRSDATARAELAYAAIVAGLDQDPFVLECLRDFIRGDPTLGEMVSTLADDPAHLDQATLGKLAAALGRVFRRTQRYRCIECGFASASHFWQCPGCRSWDTLAPVARLELAPNPRVR